MTPSEPITRFSDGFRAAGPAIGGTAPGVSGPGLKRTVRALERGCAGCAKRMRGAALRRRGAAVDSGPFRIARRPSVASPEFPCGGRPATTSQTAARTARPRKVRPVQTKIAVRHGQLNDETRDFIKGKCEKLVHLFERVTQILATVEFEHAGDRVRVELLVDAEHKHDFTAHCEGPEVVPAFESCLHKMERQLRRYKKRIQEHHGDPAARDVAGDPFADAGDADDDDDDFPPPAAPADLSYSPGGVAEPPAAA